MPERKVLECDVCLEPDAERYHVRHSGQEWSGLLCPEHAAPLNDFIQMVEEAAKAEQEAPHLDRITLAKVKKHVVGLD